MPKKIKLLFFILFPYIVYYSMLKTYIKYYFDSSEDFDIIYSQHETLDCAMLAYLLSKLKRKPFIILLQLEPYRNFRDFLSIQSFHSFRDIATVLENFNLNYSKMLLYKSIVNSQFFKGFLAVSAAPIEISNLQRSKYSILNPGNAFKSNLFSMRKKTNNKTNDAIFFARISKEKGIFNLIRIWKQISYTLSHAKLFVYGSGSKATVKKLIMQIKSNNLDDTFFYCGYIENEQELYEKVAISKIFLYPSYSDAFPLGIIESLALGTPVVAYDIPAVNNVYSNLNAVKIVKKGDIKGFSQEILKIFALDAKSYEEMIEEPRLKEFLTKHSIWKNVVDNEVMKIYEIMS